MSNAPFVTVDVFTRERFAGNPLAVFPDARDIDEAVLQKIAAEFGYSEITFVLPPENPANDARVRIFTPTVELGFAGHPNVGTAYVLGQQQTLFGKPVGDTLRFEEKAGLVEVALNRENGTVTGATIRAPQPLDIGAEVAPDIIARCATLTAADILKTNHAPLQVSVGLPFPIAELTSLAALAAARPNLDAFRAAEDVHGRTDGGFSLFLYVRDAANPGHLRARMFAPLDDIPEDPATGSASAALAAFLVETSAAPDGDHAITITQGVEMGRRSEIALSVTKENGKAVAVRISGDCVPVIAGTIAC